MSIPKEARKTAHYWYGGGKELVVFFHNRHGYVRDGKTGELPVCPERGVPYRYPGEVPSVISLTKRWGFITDTQCPKRAGMETANGHSFNQNHQLSSHW